MSLFKSSPPHHHHYLKPAYSVCRCRCRNVLYITHSEGYRTTDRA